MADIFHHAYHAAAAILRQELADSILSWPESARQRLVNDGNRLARCPVGFGESSPFQDAYAGRFEISVAHHAYIRLRMMLPRINLPSAGHLPGTVSVKRQNVRHAGGLHPRQSAHTTQYLLHPGILLRQAGKPETRIDSERIRIFGMKSRVHVQNAQKTSQQEPRPHE